MPANGYTIGRDVSLDIIGPNGPLRFGIRTGFSAKPEYNDIKVKRADGITDNAFIPDGWTGSFDYERGNSTLDDYFAGVESDYYAGLNIKNVSITETIVENTGAVTQWRYTNVALKYDDAGSKSGDTTVKQKVSWAASRRLKIT
jgi:hypothetical protein